MNIKVIVATHKEYRMPTDSMYIPVQVGFAIASSELPYLHDNTGDNISNKNKNYCELTAIYWAWKNLDADYYGLVHYRRYFRSRNKHNSDKLNNIFTKEETESILKKYDIILPKKRHYWIETNYSQYIHAHHKVDLETTRDIISRKYPEYLASYDKIMDKRSGHRFNMFIMKNDVFKDYCSWLFDILFELERELDISGYSQYDARVFGFVSERLLDVFIDKNNIKYKEISVLYLEKQNWCKKVLNFLKRKIKATYTKIMN